MSSPSTAYISKIMPFYGVAVVMNEGLTNQSSSPQYNIEMEFICAFLNYEKLKVDLCLYWLQFKSWSMYDLLHKMYLLNTNYCSYLVTSGVTGPRSAVCNVSGNRCESDCTSRGQEFDLGPVPYFHGD